MQQEDVKRQSLRVFVSEGTGKITINKRELEKYFPSSILQFIVKQPLAKLNVAEQYDIKINLDGGGFKGQSEAARLAISRALIKINPEDKAVLRAEGFVTRILVLLSVRNRVVRKLVRDSSSVNVNVICESLTSKAKRLVSKLSGFFLHVDMRKDYLMVEIKQRK